MGAVGRSWVLLGTLVRSWALMAIFVYSCALLGALGCSWALQGTLGRRLVLLGDFGRSLALLGTLAVSTSFTMPFPWRLVVWCFYGSRRGLLSQRGTCGALPKRFHCGAPIGAHAEARTIHHKTRSARTVKVTSGIGKQRSATCAPTL